jgi:hypothetical protein
MTEQVVRKNLDLRVKNQQERENYIMANLIISTPFIHIRSKLSYYPLLLLHYHLFPLLLNLITIPTLDSKGF